MENEKRIFIADDEHQLRAVKNEDGKRFIEGWGAVFEHESRLIWDWEGEFTETIRAGAFDKALAADDLDVLALRDHDNGLILGRMTAGRDNNTLSLTTDEKGLKYRVDIPNTPTGNEVFELIERGDITESSFAFRVKQEGQEWDLEGDVAKRFINEISSLHDISVVWKGAYSSTDVETAQRHFKEAEEIKNIIPRKETKLRATNDIDDMAIKLHKVKGVK
jgi:HK97 family phage prohead protease